MVEIAILPWPPMVWADCDWEACEHRERVGSIFGGSGWGNGEGLNTPEDILTGHNFL